MRRYLGRSCWCFSMFVNLMSKFYIHSQVEIYINQLKDTIPKYSQLQSSGKLHCFGKRVKTLGQGTKCQVRSCPSGKTKITMQCRNGIWRRASRKEQFRHIVNPDLCV